MKTNIKSIRHGFSLIEVILAIAILSIGLVAIMKLASLNLRTSMDSRDEIVAASLAQDGLELVYNIKDNNKAHNIADQFQSLPDGSPCRIDTKYVYSTTANPIPCPALVSGTYQLKYDSTNGFIHTGSGANTKFFRVLSLVTVGGNKIVTAYVTWGGIAPTTAMLNNGCNTSNATCNLNTKCTCAQMTLAQD